MPTHKSDFLQIAEERGFLHQCTDKAALDSLLSSQKPVTAYIGFDCTAPSLHVGSLMQIMILRWFQKCGHRPIVLMGGGTTKVGDPSGKDESRKLLDDAAINANMQGIKSIFKKFITFGDSGSNALMVNNDDWLKNLNYVEFLRDYGRHFLISKMLSMDSVKMRLEREQELTFLEFNYMILQAYDFVKLQEKYECRLQIGGSDQWGNIVNGIELYRRVFAESLYEILEIQKKAFGKTLAIRPDPKKEIFGLTTPLITTSSGAKMGKTENGAVWLNADLCKPFDYWQFWRNTEDADVGRFLRFFTELPIAEIKKLEALKDAEINEAKKILATEATKLCHGEEAAQAAAETARKTFEEGGAGENLETFTYGDDDAATVLDVLVEAQLAESRGDAKKLIAGNGVKINDKPVTDPNLKIVSALSKEGGSLKLSKGKKHHVLIKKRA